MDCIRHFLAPCGVLRVKRCLLHSRLLRGAPRAAEDAREHVHVDGVALGVHEVHAVEDPSLVRGVPVEALVHARGEVRGIDAVEEPSPKTNPLKSLEGGRKKHF